MNQKHSLTEGNILKSLLTFAIPVLFSLLLQALYGGADLLIVGRFADTVDVSGVATGSMLLSTVTNIITGLSMGLIMCVLTFFHGDLMAALFSSDAAVIAAAHSYLKAYAIDCLLTSFLFCFIDYFNGREKTLFVMLQGLIGAFGVRIPIVWLVSRIPGATLFQIGLGTPASSLVQVTLCLGMFFWMHRKKNIGTR